MINVMFISSNSVHVGFLLVPMTFGVLIKSREHNGENFGSIVTDQAHDILVVPVIQRPLSNLNHKRVIIILVNTYQNNKT